MEQLLKSLIFQRIESFQFDDAIFFAERLFYEHNSDDNLFYLAKCHYLLGKKKQTYHVLQGNQYWKNLFLFSQVCFDLGKFEEAELAMMNSVSSRSSHQSFQDLSTEDLRKFLPGGASGLFLLGQIARIQNRREVSIQRFMKCLELDPYFWSALTALGEMGVKLSLPALFGMDTHTAWSILNKPNLTPSVLSPSSTCSLPSDSHPPSIPENLHPNREKEPSSDPLLPPPPPSSSTLSLRKRTPSRVRLFKQGEPEGGDEGGEEGMDESKEREKEMGSEKEGPRQGRVSFFSPPSHPTSLSSPRSTGTPQSLALGSSAPSLSLPLSSPTCPKTTSHSSSHSSSHHSRHPSSESRQRRLASQREQRILTPKKPTSNGPSNAYPNPSSPLPSESTQPAPSSTLTPSFHNLSVDSPFVLSSSVSLGGASFPSSASGSSYSSSSSFALSTSFGSEFSPLTTNDLLSSSSSNQNHSSSSSSSSSSSTFSSSSPHSMLISDSPIPSSSSSSCLPSSASSNNSFSASILSPSFTPSPLPPSSYGFSAPSSASSDHHPSSPLPVTSALFHDEDEEIETHSVVHRLNHSSVSSSSSSSSYLTPHPSLQPILKTQQHQNHHHHHQQQQQRQQELASNAPSSALQVQSTHSLPPLPPSHHDPSSHLPPQPSRRVSFGPAARLTFSGLAPVPAPEPLNSEASSSTPAPGQTPKYESTNRVLFSSVGESERKGLTSTASTELNNTSYSGTPDPSTHTPFAMSSLPSSSSQHTNNFFSPSLSPIYPSVSASASSSASSSSATSSLLLSQQPSDPHQSGGSLPHPQQQHLPLHHPHTSRHKLKPHRPTQTLISTSPSPVSPSSRAFNGLSQEERDTATDKLSALFLLLSSIHQAHCIAPNLARCSSLISQLPLNHSQSGFVYQVQGKLLLDAGEDSLALHTLRRMQAIEPYRVKGLELLSSVMWLLKREKELCSLALHAVELDRFAPETWCVVGNSFSLQKDSMGALRCFSRSRQLNPLFTYAYTLSGHETLSQGDKEKALNYFRQALRCNPRHFNAWSGVGVIYTAQERFESAELHFRRALEINPNNQVLHGYLVSVLQAQGSDRKKREALSHISDICQRYPRNPMLHYRRAMLLKSLYCTPSSTQEEGELPPEEPFISVLRLSSTIEEEVNKEMDSLILQFQEEKEQGEREEDEEFDEEQTRIQVILSVREKYRIQGLEELLKVFETLLTLSPREPSMYRELGLLMNILGRFGEAASYFQTAVDLDPNEANQLKNEMSEIEMPELEGFVPHFN